MASLQCRFFSEVLGLNVSAEVLLPQRMREPIGPMGREDFVPGRGFPVLYLLHGLSDDQTVWTRKTSLERYAAGRNLAVIMPFAARSFYQDMACGPRYWTYLSEELPAIMHGLFPLSPVREETYVAGLSMGAYGALRLGLAQPERFAAVAGLSGALDISRRCREGSRPGSRIGQAELEGIFGRALQVEGTSADLWALARQTAAGGGRPKVYLSCGTEDALLPESRAFHRHLADLGFASDYTERPGLHEWSFWDEEIQRVLDWLPLPA